MECLHSFLIRTCVALHLQRRGLVLIVVRNGFVWLAVVLSTLTVSRQVRERVGFYSSNRAEQCGAMVDRGKIRGPTHLLSMLTGAQYRPPPVACLAALGGNNARRENDGAMRKDQHREGLEETERSHG